MEYPIADQYRYFYVPEEDLSGINVPSPDQNLPLYSAEAGRPQVILDIFLRLLESNHLYLINISLAALLIPHIPGASPWHHLPAEHALTMQRYLSSLQLILKSKSFLIVIHEEEKAHILESGEVFFGPIRYRAEKQELIRAFQLLRDRSSQDDTQVFYSHSREEKDPTDTISCILSEKDVLFFGMHPHPGRELHFHMYLKDLIGKEIQATQLTDAFIGAQRLGLSAIDFWTLLENTLEEGKDEAIHFS